MPKFSAYMRGEGTAGPQGSTGPTGPKGDMHTVFFDVDISTGELIMYADYEYEGPQFHLTDSGHLEVSLNGNG